MARKKGDRNKKPSKYHIPDGVKATFGDWIFIENIQKEGDSTFYYRVRCQCGQERVKSARKIINSKHRQCRKCFLNKVRAKANSERKERSIKRAKQLLNDNGYSVELRKLRNEKTPGTVPGAK